MLEIVAAIVAILAAILPPLIAHFVRQAQQRNLAHDALIRRSIDELDIGVSRVRGEPPVQP